MIFYISRERAHLKAPNSTEFSVLLCFFVEIIGKEKVQDEKNIRFAKLLFCLSRIICFVSLMEVFELRFRYSFVQNFTVLLLKIDFVLGNLWNRSYSKNIETGLTAGLPNLLIWPGVSWFLNFSPDRNSPDFRNWFWRFATDFSWFPKYFCLFDIINIFKWK